MQQLRIKKFSGLNVVEDTSDASAVSLSAAENVLLRPAGAVRRMPGFKRAWNLNNLREHLGGLNVSAGDRVVMLLLEANTMRALVAVDLSGYPGSVKTLGAYFLGDEDGLLAAPTVAVPDPMLDGVVAIQVLRKGLESGRRWYFSRIYREVWMGNGTDDNMVYSQTRSPRLRLAGTNQRPAVPLASTLPTPPPVAAVQAAYETVLSGVAKLRIVADGNNFAGEDGQNITFGISTHDGDNIDIPNVQATSVKAFGWPGVNLVVSAGCAYPGALGNNRIRLRLTSSPANVVGNRASLFLQSVVGSFFTVVATKAGVAGNHIRVDIEHGVGTEMIASTLTGLGISGSPLIYKITTSLPATQVFYSDLVNYINNVDPLAAGLLSVPAGIGGSWPGSGAQGSGSNLQGGVDEVSVPLSSTMTGDGTVASPKVYTVVMGVSGLHSSVDALVAYINSDPLREGVLYATATGSQSTPNVPTTWPGSGLEIWDEHFLGELNPGVNASVPTQSTPISSSRSGAGTVTSPFVYLLKLGVSADHSSASAIKAFINNDPNAMGVLRAEISSECNIPNAGLDQPVGLLSGGVDEVPDGGHPIYTRAAFAVSFYDPGVFGENAGYEGPASFVSAELTGNSFSDFLVTVQGDTTGDNARFSQLNLWMRLDVGFPGNAFGNPGPYEWIKVRTLPNMNGTYRIFRNYRKLEVTTEAPFEGRIPPCTMFEFAGNRIWAAGNVSEPSRVWLGKIATESESAPEGVNARNFLDMGGRKEEPSRPKITALSRLETRVQVHTNTSVTLIESVTLRRIVSRSDYGAINPSCLAGWSRASIPYLGSDGLIYEMGNVQFYRSEEVGVSALPLLREKADLVELTRNPWRCNLLADPTNQIVVVWLPMRMDGELGCFVMDYTANAITGPHSYPKLLSASPVSIADSRVFGCDENGNLFIVDFGGLHERELLPSPPFTRRPAGYVPPSADEGFPRIFLADGTSLDNGVRMVLATQMLDLDTPDQRKGFYSVSWTVARHSRGIVSLVVRTDDGQEKVIELGEMYGRERHKVAFAVSGNALVLRMEVICAEGAAFVMRDLTIGWESQFNGDAFMF